MIINHRIREILSQDLCYDEQSIWPGQSPKPAQTLKTTKKKHAYQRKDFVAHYV